MTKSIGTVRETRLHAGLKDWYALPGDSREAVVDRYIVDLVRGKELIEIQTGNFARMRSKLNVLLANYKVRVVYPIAIEKWILRIGNSGKIIQRRKSPKQGKVEELFNSLIYLSDLVHQEFFTLEVLFVRQEDVWRDDGKGSWHRKHWSISDRHLLGVVGSRVFTTYDDYSKLLPQGLGQQFTVSDLAQKARLTKRLSGKMVYCLNRMGALQKVGKSGKAFLYSLAI